MRPPPSKATTTKAAPRPRRSSAAATASQQASHHQSKQNVQQLPPPLLTHTRHKLVKPPPPVTTEEEETKENAAPQFKREEMTLPADILDIIPQAKLYQDLVEVEQRLDQAIMRHRILQQSKTKRPTIIPKRIRIFISHLYRYLDSPTQVPQWELRIEGRLIDDCPPSTPSIPPSHQSALEKLISTKTSKRFSDFFSLVTIELDPTLYGPKPQNLIQWKRDPLKPTDGCTITRNGESDVAVKIQFWRYNNPQKFQIQSYLAKLLGISSGTKHAIMEALFLYIRAHKLQDSKEIEYINCDSNLQLLFKVPRFKMNEIPFRLQQFLYLPECIEIDHTIRVADKHKPMIACYEMDIEVNESFQAYGPELYETFEKAVYDCDLKIRDNITKIKSSRDLFYSANRFANDPSNGLKEFYRGQSHDLETMQESFTGAEPSNRCESYLNSSMKEAVNRYLFQQVAHKRAELETNLFIRR